MSYTRIMSVGQRSRFRQGQMCDLSCASGGHRFNPFPNKPWFLRVCSTLLFKTQWEKEKLLLMSNFSFSHSVFYPFEELSNCRLQTLSVWPSLKFVVWERFEVKVTMSFWVVV